MASLTTDQAVSSVPGAALKPLTKWGKAPRSVGDPKAGRRLIANAVGVLSFRPVSRPPSMASEGLVYALRARFGWELVSGGTGVSSLFSEKRTDTNFFSLRV